MKKIVALSAAVAMSVSASAVTTEELVQQINSLKQELQTLKKAQEKSDKKQKRLKKSFNEVKAHDAADNIKFGVDLRSSYDSINYKTASGLEPTSGLLSNRLLLTMAQQPMDDLIFKGKLAVNKVFGHNNMTATNGFNNYDWFGTVTPDDNVVRLREAYFVYFGEMGDVGYTASIGRRPSLNGTAGNLREDDEEASPLAHNINMEFDGASFNFKLDKVTSIPGFAFKICLGRGYSNANGKYVYTPVDFQTGTPAGTNDSYASNLDTPDMDMIGFISKLYDDGQYSATLNGFYASNLLGVRDMTNFHAGFQDVGDMTGGALTFVANGIGDDIFGFWGQTKAFASVAISKTDPRATAVTNTAMGNQNLGMLGTTEKKTGNSVYLGVQMPCLLTDDGRLGVEYNHGTKWWRSFTYGEDTMIGSKLAARGDAYEVYWTKPLVGKNVDMQLRYTRINYDYTGSDMFFGGSGTPMTPENMYASGMGDPVSEASNFRAYIRYRY